ncbi:MAG: AAA family ATPase [Clostridia bacterium]|nr:AAA family ATPase [Clostridia bacterium]
MKTLYLIGGTMGVGKTTVSQILKKCLPNAVYLDGDWCWDASPFQVTEETKTMVLDNICYLLGNFLSCSAYENIVFSWVMHEQSIIDSILTKLPLSNCKIRSISLVCNAETLKSRLQKDISTGIRTADIVERSIARIPLYSRLNTEKVDTNGKNAEEIAQEIITATERNF